MTQAFVFKSWTNSDVARLRVMWWQGLDEAVIAARFDLPVHVVLEKIDRESMKRGPTYQPGVHEMERLVRAEDEPDPLLHDDGTPITMRNAKDRHCHWIKGEPPTGDSQMCGHPVHRGNYCFHHRVRAYPRALKERYA